MFDQRFVGSWQLHKLVRCMWTSIWYLVLACLALQLNVYLAFDLGMSALNIKLSLCQQSWHCPPQSGQYCLLCETQYLAIKSNLILQEDGELDMEEEEPEPAPYAKTLTLERPW